MSDPARGPETGAGPAIGAGAFARATRLSMITAGLGALFLTVCNNQPIFAVYFTNHLGAPPSVLGALFGLMQAMGLLQLLSVLVYRALPRRKPWFIAAHLLHRGLGLLIAASALLFVPGAQAPGGGASVRLAFLAMALSWALWNVSTSGWLSWMADLVPEDVRSSFFLRRSAVFQSATVLWFFAASVFLDLVDPGARSLAYAAIFGIGALGGVADILIHLAIPEPLPHRPQGPLRLKEFLSPLADPNFLRYSLGIGVAVFAIFVAQPFQAPYVTDPARVGAPNVWLGIMTVITILAWVAMAPLWGFVMDRYGRKPAVILGCLLVSGWLGYLLVDHRNYSYILPLVALVAGFFGPAFWEGSGQLMLTLAPPAHRVVYIAWYNTIVGLVSAAGPLVGGLLGDALPPGGLSALPFPLSRLEGFHAAQALALLVMAVAVLVLRGVREGRERPVAGLVSQIASAGIFRTYATLFDLKRHSGDPRVERALRRIDGDEGELVIREVVDRLDDPSPEAREEALRALGRIATPEARSAIAARLADPASDLRAEAARILGRLGDTDALPALEAAAREADPVLRAAAAGALGALGGRGEASPLAAILALEPDSRVHDAAALGASSFDAATPERGLGLAAEALDLYDRLRSAPNRARRLQYALGLARLLGARRDFARLSTGAEAARARAWASLAAALERRLLALDPAAALAFRAEAFTAALEAADGAAALAQVLAAHDAFVAGLLGPEPDPARLAALLARTDLRLAAWHAVATLARGPSDPPGGESALLLALAGASLLSGE